VEGVGVNLGLEVTIQSQYPEGLRTCTVNVFDNVNASISYSPPHITGMENAIDMPTNGTTSVTIQGANFGPQEAYNVISATYGEMGTEYSTNCVLLSDNSLMTCQVVEGK